MRSALLNSSIVAIAAVDLFLTGVFLRHSFGRSTVAVIVRAAVGDQTTATAESKIFAATQDDVNAAMFLLRRSGDITSEVFSCPATQPSEPARSKSEEKWINWDKTPAEFSVHDSISWNIASSERSIEISPSSKP